MSPAPVTEHDDLRLCGCGCWQSLDDRRGNVLYVNRSHQQRAYRAKVKAEAEANGIPGSLSLRTVRAGHSTQNRHVDGPIDRTGHQRARKRAPDLRISYRKAVEIVEERLRHYGVAPGCEHAVATLWMDRGLTERQRAALDRREVRT